MNLKELFEEYTITIPPMQRDYAQGRNNEKSTRELFLNTLYNHLFNQPREQHLNLDFIYGYREDSNKDSFILLDGQQRITTLWLLYMYFYGRLACGNTDFLKKFTYAVRESAKLASEYICNKIQNFEEKPSIIFKSSIDFSKKWEIDPTVIALLNMYDAIYEKFNDIAIDSSILDKLNNIHFSLIDMEEYKLGEELYIQMNSRGKTLTMFENFKAWVMRDGETNAYFSKTYSFENKWAELFWEMSMENYDACAMHFVHFFGLYLRYTNDKKNNYTYNDFRNNLYKLNKSLYYPNGIIKNELTGLFMHKALLLMDKVISYINYLRKNEIAFSLDKMDAANTMRLFSIIAFVEVNQKEIFDENNKIYKKDNIQNFKDWYGFINRIIDNNRQQNDSDTVYATYLYIKHFRESSKDIISELSVKYNKDNIPYYAKESTEEEIIKSKLILLSRNNNLEWEKEIDIAHSNDYFKGKILFLLKYSQIGYEKYDINLFRKYYKAVNAIFSIENLNDIHKLHRVFLSQYNYAWRNINYDLGSGSSDMRLRLVWHKEFFLKKITNQNSEYMFKTFLDIYNSNIEQKDIFNYIVKISLENTELWNFKTNWWRYLLVRFPSLLYMMEKNRYYFESNSRPVYLLKTLRKSKNARNLLLCALNSYMKELSLTTEILETSIIMYNEFKILSLEDKNVIKIEKNNEEICYVEYKYNKPEDFFDEIIEKLK